MVTPTKEHSNFYIYVVLRIVIIMDRTPVNTRQAEAATPGASGASGAPVAPVFANPPPGMVMSPDQFKVFMDTCSPAATAAAIAAAVPAAQGRLLDDSGEDYPNVSSVAVKLPTIATANVGINKS